ncbi:MAG: lipopolysaccharide biosynthesis protein [Dysgonamonadaceae bacterium]|nr:lipopolysaccharide biosynthesis protein [Dysgonamonadaceae bacterium]
MSNQLEPGLKQKTARGLFWGGFSIAVQQAVGLIFGIVFARLLSEEDYGLVAELSIFTGIAGTIINSGFSTALTNKQDASDKDYNSVFWFSVIAGSVIYIALFFSAPLIAQYFHEPSLTLISRVLFLTFLIGGISTSSYTYLYKNIKIKQLAIIDIMSLITACLSGLLLVLNGCAYWALVIQTLIFITLGSILKIIISPWKPSLSLDLSPLRAMFPFSIKILVTWIFIQINNNIFSVIIGRMFGKRETGIYSQGQKWASMGCSLVTTMISSVTHPVLVRTGYDKARQVNALRKLIRFGAFVSFPLLLGLAFVSDEFIIITIGEKWLPSSPYLQLFCIWASMQFLSTIFTSLIFTHGKSNIYMNVTVITGTVQIVSVILLASSGIFTMITVYVSISLSSLFVWHHYVKKLVGIKLAEAVKDISPYLIITVGCFIITALITQQIKNIYILFAAKIIISGSLYIIVLKTINSIIYKESIEFLKQLLKSFQPSFRGRGYDS